MYTKPKTVDFDNKQATWGSQTTLFQPAYKGLWKVGRELNRKRKKLFRKRRKAVSLTLPVFLQE